MIQSPVCGRPALFVTVNPADTLWPELFRRTVGEEEERGLTKEQRQRILAEHPVLAARFYHQRLRLLLKHIIKGGAPIFGHKVVDHWYRIEFQFRGSPHAHCIFWLEGVDIPEQVSSVDHAALFELAELASCSLHSKLPDGFDFSGVRRGEHEDEGRDEADAQAAYAERLLDEDENPSPRAFDPWDDHGGAFKPPKFQKYVADVDHPARRDAIVDGDEDALDADLFALEVAFQQHVCVKNFCNKPGNPACKRRYPRAFTDRSIMSKTKDAKGRHRAALQTPRNHRWVVPYNRHLLQAWRGNVDVQVISDPKGAAAYAAAIACYSTKPDTPDNREVERALYVRICLRVRVRVRIRPEPLMQSRRRASFQ